MKSTFPHFQQTPFVTHLSNQRGVTDRARVMRSGLNFVLLHDQTSRYRLNIRRRFVQFLAVFTRFHCLAPSLVSKNNRNTRDSMFRGFEHLPVANRRADQASMAHGAFVKLDRGNSIISRRGRIQGNQFQASCRGGTARCFVQAHAEVAGRNSFFFHFGSLLRGAKNTASSGCLEASQMGKR